MASPTLQLSPRSVLLQVETSTIYPICSIRHFQRYARYHAVAYILQSIDGCPVITVSGDTAQHWENTLLAIPDINTQNVRPWTHNWFLLRTGSRRRKSTSGNIKRNNLEVELERKNDSESIVLVQYIKSFIAANVDTLASVACSKNELINISSIFNVSANFKKEWKLKHTSHFC